MVIVPFVLSNEIRTWDLKYKIYRVYVVGQQQVSSESGCRKLGLRFKRNHVPPSNIQV